MLRLVLCPGLDSDYHRQFSTSITFILKLNTLLFQPLLEVLAGVSFSFFSFVIYLRILDNSVLLIFFMALNKFA